MRPRSIDQVVELVDAATEDVFGFVGLEWVERAVSRATSTFGVESRKSRAGRDAVFTQEELLIEGGEAYERDVVDRFELLLAVRGVGTVGTLTVPVRRGRERRLAARPRVVGVEYVAALVVETLVGAEVETRVAFAGELEPPEPTLAINDRAARAVITVSVGLQHPRGVGQSETATGHRDARARTDAVEVGRLARPRSLEGAFEHAARGGHLDDLMVLDQHGRVGETLVHAPDPHERLDRGDAATLVVAGQSRPDNELGTLTHRRSGVDDGVGRRGVGVPVVQDLERCDPVFDRAAPAPAHLGSLRWRNVVEVCAAAEGDAVHAGRNLVTS